MSPVPLLETCDDILRAMDAWRRVESGGQIFRVRPDLIDGAQVGDRVRWQVGDVVMCGRVLQ